MTALCTTLPDNLCLLLVDDHRIFLDGLSLALSSLSQNLQIHTAHSAAEAEQRLRQHGYDLILLDLRLPDEPGIELLQRWLARGESTPVAILSASDSTLEAQAALAAGALGFISKSSDGNALRRAVTRVLLGETLPVPSSPSPLTPRQLEILRLLAEGLPNKVISRQLGLAEDTVKTHLKALFETLAVHTRTACVSAARHRGWL
ncbi:response regulator transcription factor [Ectopseudomonas mendocina]|uniref:LuxR family transcriptional regulator n=1 Tax=Ectopseudomonas mendocina S5.2 TaxID=1225174 RepID=A0ABM5VYA6_ECTME|nr:response regulator transcription factor [Pseudomonas mendocina]ALN19803.1 LuxR family transcriptional regulator [Pseudomonas mendocina S5.2]KER99310.1 LuxR family transcriptional regulator [Pseudomonas mendocina]